MSKSTATDETFGLWQQLTASQRDTLKYLISDIVEGNVNLNQVSGKQCHRLGAAILSRQRRKRALHAG